MTYRNRKTGTLHTVLAEGVVNETLQQLVCVREAAESNRCARFYTPEDFEARFERVEVADA